jgi:hypothetical protein
MLMVNQYQLPMSSTLFEALLTSTWDSQQISQMVLSILKTVGWISKTIFPYLPMYLNGTVYVLATVSHTQWYICTLSMYTCLEYSDMTHDSDYHMKKYCLRTVLATWKVIFCTTHTQNRTNILIDSEDTMNYGGCFHTTAATIFYSPLQGIKTLANMLCNKFS